MRDERVDVDLAGEVELDDEPEPEIEPEPEPEIEPEPDVDEPELAEKGGMFRRRRR